MWAYKDKNKEPHEWHKLRPHTSLNPLFYSNLLTTCAKVIKNIHTLLPNVLFPLKLSLLQSSLEHWMSKNRHRWNARCAALLVGAIRETEVFISFQSSIPTRVIWTSMWEMENSHHLRPGPGSSGFWPCHHGSEQYMCPHWLWWNDPLSSGWFQWPHRDWSSVPKRNKMMKILNYENFNVFKYFCHSFVKKKRLLYSICSAFKKLE